MLIRPLCPLPISLGFEAGTQCCIQAGVFGDKCDGVLIVGNGVGSLTQSLLHTAQQSKAGSIFLVNLYAARERMFCFCELFVP